MTQETYQKQRSKLKHQALEIDNLKTLKSSPSISSMTSITSISESSSVDEPKDIGTGVINNICMQISGTVWQ